VPDQSSWFDNTHPDSKDLQFAYFSAEFALSESLPIYSGGLGVLAGDHLKSARDLGLPLVGVGLAYKEGYFVQELDPSGWQTEKYLHNRFEELPLQLERGTDGSPVRVGIPIPGGEIGVQIWRVEVGSVPLYLLDSDVEGNDPHHRLITHRLYGGDNETRILQEMLLGIGGVKALRTLGVRPDVYHINEGHAAFLLFERVRQAMEEGLTFAGAWKQVAATSVFTTHTPVPAGFDLFPRDLMQKYFETFAREAGVSWEDLLRMGQEHPGDRSEPFNMALFALRNAGYRNGVSRLHGKVSRAMWKSHWPDCPEHEIPIGHITNGVHVRTWTSDEMASLFDRHLGREWSVAPEGVDWSRVEAIPAQELWRAHQEAKARLIDLVRERCREQVGRWGGSEEELRTADRALDHEHLVVGFARRFAPYKRATLILRDRERLKSILGAAGRPIQFVFAGKSHPANYEGKHLIQEIVQFAREPDVRGKVVFLENYDMSVARHLVQGVDLWLNTPRRPLEASGTSGMKGAMNGVLNLSVLDGWWDEGYSPDSGWVIATEEAGDDHQRVDAADAESLYRVLEEQVVPAYYEREEGGLPGNWIARMKSSLARHVPLFNADRMVREYVEQYYLEAARSGE
jgi:starch phosphorylase